MMKSPAFLFALLLLLVNDLFLKAEFGNFITGKLSDVAGIFVFPLFWLSFFPKKKRLVFILSGLFFIWWKSPMSQWAIKSWNALSLFQIGRVVDYGDLAALLILPFAWWYADKARPGFVLLKKIPPVVPLGLACFAFVATTLPPKYFMVHHVP
jgi:hypothetical protein